MTFYVRPYLKKLQVSTLFNALSSPLPGKLSIYSGSVPVDGNLTAGNMLLAQFVLNMPCGVIINDGMDIQLTSPEFVTAVATGNAGFARIETNGSQACVDLDISVPAGAASLKLSDVNMVSGKKYYITSFLIQG